MSIRRSYGIVLHKYRSYILVNAGFGDPVDVLLDMSAMQICNMQDYYNGIETVLYHDQHPYRVVQLIFTMNNGSVASARYVYYNKSGEPVNLANIEKDVQKAMMMARLVVWSDYLRNDLPSAIKDAVKTSKLCEEIPKDEEICAICLKEYEPEDMIRTLRCKHSYHDKCTTKWLKKTREINCPKCRDRVFVWDLNSASLLI
ncbi:hypothetical protein R6Q59_017478 [Mikania micrantha]|uniref:RING-type domain-containing protein n=1 Tax=Mikania micrantha TaxID=192012 RepID=A0A5N6M3M4_9ASTR|nr:hypothetical protein E3N88_36389 [Mikania micrantha]